MTELDYERRTIDPSTFPPEERQDHVVLHLPELARRLGIEGQVVRVFAEQDNFPGYLHIILQDAPVPPGRLVARGGYCDQRILGPNDKTVIGETEVPEPVDKWQELLEAANDIISDAQHPEGAARLTGTTHVVGSLERLSNALEAIDPTVLST